jgi:hypothetical protein
MALNKAQLMDVPGGPGITGSVKAGTGISIGGDGTISVTAPGGVSKLVAGTNISLTPSTGLGDVTISASAGVTKLIAGTNISLNPTSGIGDVTISASGSGGDGFPSGTSLLFAQSSAPTGWVINTSNNDYAVRIVTSGGGSTGGNNSFSSAFSNYTPSGNVSSSGSCTPNGSVSLSGLSVTGINVSGSVGSATISEAQMPSHTHNYQQRPAGGNQTGNGGGINNQTTSATTATGGGQGHNHSFSGSASGGSVSGNASFSGSSTSVSVSSSFSGSQTSQFAVRYVNVLICTKS